MKRTDAAVAGVLAVLTAACFYPLLRFYFAQDDFMLFQWATREPLWLLERMFGRGPTYFRPLTMFGYFAGAGKLFGAWALPWHVASLLLHIANVCLTFALLLRLRVNRPAAALGAAAFGLNLAFFHVVAWITCTQQLLATLFTLAAVRIWCDALGGSRRAQVLSLVCYLAASLSLEQAYFLPGALLVMALAGIGGAAMGRGPALRMLWPHLAAMGALLLFRTVWKGTPGEGPAEVGVGWHLLVNLWKYLAALVDFFPAVPGRLEMPSVLSPRQLVIPALIVYQLMSGRRREAIFGGVFIAAMLAPALLLRDHAFHYHTYAAAFGFVYLLALLFEDLLGLVARGSRSRARLPRVISAAAVLALALAVSLHVRRIDRAAVLSKHLPWQEQTSFVLHRALLAADARDDILAKVHMPERIRAMRLVLFVPQQGLVGREHRDMRWALGLGALPNVVLGQSFEVRFDVGAVDMGALEAEDTLEERVLLYDPYGNIYTPGELRERPDLR